MFEFIDRRLQRLSHTPMWISMISGVCAQGMWNAQVKGQVTETHRLKVDGHGPLARYVRLLVAHAPGMPGTFSQPLRICDPDMHHGTFVTHVPCCIPGSLTSGFLWSRWRGKRPRYFRRMRNPQFYVSGKRPIITQPSVWHHNGATTAITDYNHSDPSITIGHQH